MPLLWGCGRCGWRQRSVISRRRVSAFHTPATADASGATPWHIERDVPELCPIKAQVRLIEMLWEASRPAAYYGITGTTPPAVFDVGEAMQYLLSTGDVDYVAGRAIKTTFAAVGGGVTCRVVSTFDREAGLGAFARVLAEWRLKEGLIAAV